MWNWDNCIVSLFYNTVYLRFSWETFFFTGLIYVDYTYYKLIADPSKIGTASLIKFGDNSNNKKKHFLHLTRGINFHPFHQQKYHKYNISFILWSFLANMSGHNYIFVTSFLQLSTGSNNKKYFKKVFKNNFES